MIDNPTMVQYFGRHILAGPEEELLEGFYFALGARWITSMVKTESLISHPLSKQSAEAVALRQHVLERLTIFLAEARRKQAEYTIDVLRQEGRFVINEVRGLQVRYTLRSGRQEHAHYEVSQVIFVAGTFADLLDPLRHSQQEQQERHSHRVHYKRTGRLRVSNYISSCLSDA